MNEFIAENVTVEAAGREVIRNVSFQIRSGEIHALVGPNGSGKSSLSFGLFGHPEYKITKGTVRLNTTDLLALPTEERARQGLFLSFQEPPEIGGVSMHTFIRAIGGAADWAAEAARGIGADETFLARFLNEGFSGGEKKKSEIIQLSARRPKFAILDEIDTGLDRDTVAKIPGVLEELTRSGAGILLITHSFALLRALSLSSIIVVSKGAISQVGGSDFLSHLEQYGYEAVSESNIV